MGKGTKKRKIKLNLKIQKYIDHARARAKERLGVEFLPEDIKAITKMIQTDKSKFIFNYSNNYSCHEVTYQNKTFRVVYDKQNKIVSTILPEEAYDGV